MTWQWAGPIVLAAALAVLTPRILRALPAPSDEPDSDPYGPLATAWFALTAFALMAVAGLLVVWLVPGQTLAWVGLSTFAVLAAMIDARTEYLPKRLMQACWLTTAAGVVASAALAGDWQLLVRSAVGALAVTSLFWLFWRIGGGFGFGDVRLAPVIGATAASVSWTMLAGALLFGGIVGVLWGVIWRALGRGRAFPYGPALVAGPYLALLLNGLLR